MIADLQLYLAEICEKFNLKQRAFNGLEEIFQNNLNEDLDEYDLNKIHMVFDGYEFKILHSFFPPTIDTKISLYINESVLPIGYYKLQTNLKGETIDDFFFLE
ncbi:MAG: hypothetical protein AB7E26_05305 [Chryseobacterium sp.]